MFPTAAFLPLLTCLPAVWAHGGIPATPDTWPAAWNADGLVLLNLGLLGWLYARGLAALWGRAGAGRGVGRFQAAAYLASLATLFVALISPLDALAEELSSAHMAQHMLLMTVAAPLFVLGSPALVLAWGLPRPWRPAFGHAWRWLDVSPLWRPMPVWLLYAATLWAWHLPALYHAALRHPLVHDAQHLSFFAAACLFWRALLDPLSRRRLHPAAAVFFLFTTALHAAVLGIFMTLAPRPWYADYAGRTAAWGLTPLEDQQLAGLIMWAPGCLVYPVAAAAVFGVWLARLPGAPRGEPAACPATGGGG
jgi:putative membrane protein